MRRGVPQVALTVLVLLSLGSPAPAALDNSHHDLRQYLPEADMCLVCHGRSDVDSYPPMEAELGTVGTQCIFLCHSGKGILPESDGLVPKPGPSVDTADYGTVEANDFTAVYFTRSHGRQPANLTDGTGKPVPWPPAGATSMGVSGGVALECTTCHSVHDNRHAPFLAAPLAASYPSRDGICDRCHPERATGNLTGPPDGTHPVDFAVDAEAASTRQGQGRHPRRIVIQRYGSRVGTGSVSVFDVPGPAATDLNDKTVHWNMGGHLSRGPDRSMARWAGGADKQQMGCYTCHSAHRTNLNGEEKLVVVRAAASDNGWNPLCVGCHGAAVALDQDMTDWNVGMTAFGHTAGARTGRDASGFYTTSVGGFKFRIESPAAINAQGPSGFGGGGKLLCTTCHRVHFGMPGSMAIANLGQNLKSVCKSCHVGMGIPNENDFTKGGTVATGHNAPNSHHVTAQAVKIEESYLPANEPRPTLYVRAPSWANYDSGLGDIARGMDCADCHTFNGTAHNW